jgi:hypothetical protein
VSSLDGDNFSSIESETSEDEPEFIREGPSEMHLFYEQQRRTQQQLCEQENSAR